MQVNVTTIASIVGIAAVLAAAADRIAFYRLAPVETKVDLVEGRLGRVENRLGRVEGQLGHVEGRLGRVEDRLGQVEGRLTSLESRVRDGFAEANRRFGEVTETLQALAAQFKQLRSDLAKRGAVPGNAFDDSPQESTAPQARESKHQTPRLNAAGSLEGAMPGTTALADQQIEIEPHKLSPDQ